MGLAEAGELILKKSTRNTYKSVLGTWIQYLNDGGLPHIEGAIISDVNQGVYLAQLIIGYISWLVRRDYSVTGFRGRCAAVINANRMAFHSITTLPLVWRLVKGWESTHQVREKGYLTLRQLKMIAKYIAGVRKPDKYHRIMTCIYYLVTITMYRLGSLIPPDNGNRKDICTFDWKGIRIYKEKGVWVVGVKQIEKIGKRPIRKTRMRKAKEGEKPALFEAITAALWAQGFKDGEQKGPITHKGIPITQSNFRAWLDRMTKGAGVGMMVEGEPRKVRPSDLRRSAITQMYFYVGPERVQYMVGHLSSNTARDFYVGIDEEEQARLLGSIPWME